jgi:drug/metabolite transporter (DMT)-like permease
MCPLGLGFTLMAVGQTYSPPTHAAMILSLEGVFASVASYTFLDETLSNRELSGCALMLLATLIAKVGVRCMDHKSGTCLIIRVSLSFL